MKPGITTLWASKGRMSRFEMKFSLLFAAIFVQAVLHKEFVGAKPDKLLGAANISHDHRFPYFLANSFASAPSCLRS